MHADGALMLTFAWLQDDGVTRDTGTSKGGKKLYSFNAAVWSKENLSAIKDFK